MSVNGSPLPGLNLTCIRGLSGSGKTTLARKLQKSAYDLYGDLVPVFEADDFFMKDGVYTFDGRMLEAAHHTCQVKVNVSLGERASCIVANTFSQRWELEPYLVIAREWGAEVEVIDLFDSGLTDDELFLRNDHGVPLETIARMRRKWEANWKDGNPTPPQYRIGG